MSRSIAFTQVKGGQGTSTVAATVALLAATGQQHVTLVVDNLNDTLALLGVGNVFDVQHVYDVPNRNMTITTYDAFTWGMVTDLFIFDNPGTDIIFDEGFLVIRPCYLALRKATQTAKGWNGIVLVNEEGRALRKRDIEDVLGCRVVAEVNVDPAIARAIDAGLLSSRIPRAMHELGLFGGTVVTP